jgi:hypothetical protein
MAEKKRIYESDMMALPPLRLVIGDVPSPEPEKKRNVAKNAEKLDREMEIPVRKLIAHLEEKKG